MRICDGDVGEDRAGEVVYTNWRVCEGDVGEDGAGEVMHTNWP